MSVPGALMALNAAAAIAKNLNEKAKAEEGKSRKQRTARKNKKSKKTRRN